MCSDLEHPYSVSPEAAVGPICFLLLLYGLVLFHNVRVLLLNFGQFVTGRSGNEIGYGYRAGIDLDLFRRLFTAGLELDIYIGIMYHSL